MKKKPKIAICAGYEPGFKMVKFALEQSYPIEFVATCANDNSEFKDLIVKKSNEKNIECIFDVNANHENFIKELKEREIDIILLLWWPDIIKKKAIATPSIGWINVHPSLLPYNRGKHPYYWAIVDGTPFGTTLHFIDEGIDTGNILFQKQIPIDVTDTGETLYKKSVKESILLFEEAYSDIVQLKYQRKEQDSQVATFHYKKNIEESSTIDLEKSYLAKDLINIMRARTFHGSESSYFYCNGKKYFVKMIIEEEKNHQS